MSDPLATQATFAGHRSSPPFGLPAAGLTVALAVAWMLFGLIGHDPWKPDEAHYFGVVIDLLQRGDWVVPSLAGEPWVEKPPLFYLFAAALAHLSGTWLPLHDAARLATGLLVGMTLVFLALTGRELYGRGYGSAAVLVMIGCLGTVARLHQLVADVALLFGVAVGLYGLALARRRAIVAGATLGIGAACAFLAKGLLGPGWLGITAILLPLFTPWRRRGYAVTLAAAATIAAVPPALWMHALYARSPQLFHDWLIGNNFGRFFGFVRLGTHNPPGFYEWTLLWYALPALPLAGFALWQGYRTRAEGGLEGLALPGLLAAVILAVLALASDSRDLYLMPIVLPLSLLAARAVRELPSSGTDTLSRAARWGGGVLALLLWCGWLVLVTGVPALLHAALAAHQPGFQPRIHWLRLVLALAATGVAVRAMHRPARLAGSAIAQWAVAVTLCWALIATLWTPYLNAGKSYRAMIRSLVRELPASGCVASWHLGEPQRALLEYHAGITTIRREVAQDRRCPALLVQGWRADGAPAPDTRWILVWEGARPGDARELYRLYRSDVAPGTPVVRFPR